MEPNSEPAHAAPDVAHPPSLASRWMRDGGLQASYRRTRSAADWVLYVGLAHAGYAAVALYLSYRRTERESVWFASEPDDKLIEFAGQPMTVADARWASSAQVAIAGVAPLALGVAFLNLANWARRAPVQALGIAIAGYVALVVADLALAPRPLLGGEVWKLLGLAALIAGYRSARVAAVSTSHRAP
jgi:hypothetical protein